MGGEMNGEAERYLRRATRGLWGRRRREVRDELEAHLHERVLTHRIAGLSEHDAVERALAELGSPGLVSAGMARLYTLPTVMGSSLAAVTACVAVVASLPNGLAQSVRGTFYWPSVACVNAVAEGSALGRDEACFWTSDSFWLNRESLRRALEPQGVTLSSTSVPGASQQEDGLMRVTLPNETTVYTPLGSPDDYLMDEDGRLMHMAEGYFSFWDLLRNASLHRDLDVSVSGWDNPRVSLGDASFRLGTNATPVSGERFYSAYLGAVLKAESGASAFDAVDAWGIAFLSPDADAATKARLARLRDARLLSTTAATLQGAAGGVYGVMTYLEPDSRLAEALLRDGFPRDAFFLLQPVRLSEGGTLALELPGGSSTFVERFGDEPAPNTSMLVRLGGAGREGWYEVVSPENISLAAQN